MLMLGGVVMVFCGLGMVLIDLWLWEFGLL